MTIFWWSVAALLLLALLLISWSLLKKRQPIQDNQTEQNRLLAKEKLAELEQDLKAGEIDQASYEQAKEELEKNLLEDTAVADMVIESRSLSAKLAAIALWILIPALSLGLYWQLGRPDLVQAQPVAMQNNPHAQSGEAPTMEDILQTLEQKLEQNPQDAEGWFLLGRVYQELNRFDQAAKAFEQLAKLTENHPQALIAWADALAMTQGGRVAGKPYELVLQALDQQPEDTTALWLAGKGAVEMQDYQNALYYWRRAEAGLAQNPQYLAELQGLIAQLKQIATEKGIELDDPGSSLASSPSPASLSIAIELSLAAELQDQVQPEDTVFVFAKQVDGRPMPVAAIKLPAAELPAQLKLSDQHLLQGGHLSDYQQLKLMARVAKSGQPMAASGDLQSADQIIIPGQTESVRLIIDQIVP